MARTWLLLGTGFGFMSVLLGAFGGHALKTRLSEYSLGVYQTGLQYQFWHALALILLGLYSYQKGIETPLAGWSFVAGVLLFSGSLYALALSGVKMWGAVTPFGGTLFLLGWASFAWTVWKN